MRLFMYKEHDFVLLTSPCEPTPCPKCRKPYDSKLQDRRRACLQECRRTRYKIEKSSERCVECIRKKFDGKRGHCKRCKFMRVTRSVSRNGGLAPRKAAASPRQELPKKRTARQSGSSKKKRNRKPRAPSSSRRARKQEKYFRSLIIRGSPPSPKRVGPRKSRSPRKKKRGRRSSRKAARVTAPEGSRVHSSDQRTTPEPSGPRTRSRTRELERNDQSVGDRAARPRPGEGEQDQSSRSSSPRIRTRSRSKAKSEREGGSHLKDRGVNQERPRRSSSRRSSACRRLSCPGCPEEKENHKPQKTLVILPRLQNPHRCSKCGVGFPDLERLENHQRRHKSRKNSKGQRGQKLKQSF